MVNPWPWSPTKAADPAVVERVNKALDKLPLPTHPSPVQGQPGWFSFRHEAYNELVDWFVAQGYRGARYSSSRCIMANYLAAETGIDYLVTYDRWEADDDIEHGYGEAWSPALSAFIMGFDDNRWPGLVAPDE